MCILDIFSNFFMWVFHAKKFQGENRSNRACMIPNFARFVKKGVEIFLIIKCCIDVKYWISRKMIDLQHCRIYMMKNIDLLVYLLIGKWQVFLKYLLELDGRKLNLCGGFA